MNWRDNYINRGIASKMSLPVSILGLKAILEKDKLGSFWFMIKSVSQGLGSALSVILTTNGSVLPVPGKDNYVFVS